MNSRSNIQSELKQLNSSLPFDVKQPVFDLPDGYFENFASGVLAKIKGEPVVSPADELTALSPLLAGLSKQMPFSVPNDYFNQQPVLLHHEPASNLLQQAGRQMPYAVPAGYFEELPALLLKKLQPAAGAKVISMSATRRFMQYAAAAVVTGLVVLGSILYLKDSPTDPASQPQTWVAKKLKNVSTQELDAFIKNTVVVGTETAAKNAPGKTEVRKLLQDVADSELDAFLSNVPSDEAADDFSVIN